MIQTNMQQLHPKMRYIYAGCDSHKNTHTMVFLTCFYEYLGTLVVPNVPSEFPKFIEQAKQFLQPHTQLYFGFEDTSSYGRNFVKYLLSEGFGVKHISSNLVASERNSKNTLDKSDLIDAQACARVLINRFDELPDATTDDKRFIFKNLVSRRSYMVKTISSLKRQLHTLLSDHYPLYQTFFGEIDCQSALAFYENFPSPTALETTTHKELTSFFKNQSAMGHTWSKNKASLILNAVANSGVVAFDYQEQRDFVITSIISQIKSHMNEIELIETHLEMFLNFFDIPLTSIKGVSIPLACSFINEIGDISRFKNAAALAKYAGIAPVSYASGNSHTDYANRRGNRELSAAFHKLAIMLATPRGPNKHIINPIMYQYYEKKLREGKTKKQALKSVKRRLVSIIYGIMKYKHDYINPPCDYLKPPSFFASYE